MKNFIHSLLLFLTFPFIFFVIAYLFTEQFYTISGGDLNKLGKIPFEPDYRDFQKSEIAQFLNRHTL